MSRQLKWDAAKSLFVDQAGNVFPKVHPHRSGKQAQHLLHDLEVGDSFTGADGITRTIVAKEITPSGWAKAQLVWTPKP